MVDKKNISLDVLEQALELGQKIDDSKKPKIKKDSNGFYYNNETGVITDKKGNELDNDGVFEALGKNTDHKITEKKEISLKKYLHGESLLIPELIYNATHKAKYSYVFIGDTGHSTAYERNNFINNSEDKIQKSGMSLCIEFDEKLILKFFTPKDNEPLRIDDILKAPPNIDTENNVLKSLPKTELKGDGFECLTIEEMAIYKCDFIENTYPHMHGADKEIQRKNAEDMYVTLYEAKRNGTKIIFGENESVSGFDFAPLARYTDFNKGPQLQQDDSFQLREIDSLHALLSSLSGNRTIEKESLRLIAKSDPLMLETEGYKKLEGEWAKDIDKFFETNMPTQGSEIIAKQNAFIDNYIIECRLDENKNPELSKKIKAVDDLYSHYNRKVDVLSKEEKEFLLSKVGQNYNMEILASPVSRDRYLYEELKQNPGTVVYRGYGHTMGSYDLDDVFPKKEALNIPLFKNKENFQDFFSNCLKNSNFELGCIVRKAHLQEEEKFISGLQQRKVELPDYIMFSEENKMYRTEEFLKNHPDIALELRFKQSALDEKSRELLSRVLPEDNKPKGHHR